MTTTLTIYFVVGGGDHHYQNLERSIRSINERVRTPVNISVLEIGTKLVSRGNVRVWQMPELIDFSEKQKIGFKFWQQKYRIAEFIDTPYGMYLDTDTVLVNDTFETILQTIGKGFGVAQHFWVPTFGAYMRHAVPWRNMLQYLTLKRKIGIKNKDPFYAGGAFVFKNTPENRALLGETAVLYDDIYPVSSSYVRGITDEVFFSAILARHHKDALLGGAFNHCCMGDTFMPLRLHNGVLEGKNAFESSWETVTFFHCDVSRRDPSKGYDGALSDHIKKAWFL